MIRAFGVVLLAMLVVPASAQSAQDLEPLTGNKLRSTFEDRTMDGIYKRIMQRSGTHQFTETFHADGTTDYREGDIQDQGRWVISGDLICFRYAGALAGGASCFAVFKSGTCLYSYSPQAVGPDGMPKDPNYWSVKTIIRGDVSTCDNLVS